MAFTSHLAIALLFSVLNLCLQGTYGDYGGGWEGGHATFYGGGDASGTMGKLPSSKSLFFFSLSVFLHFGIIFVLRLKALV